MNNNMEADKMFEELGYLKSPDGKTESTSRVEYRFRGMMIEIDKEFKHVYIGQYNDARGEDDPVDISIAELKAINKKCEELGWL